MAGPQLPGPSYTTRSPQIFNRAGDMNLQRKRHRANLLSDGTVFLSGGAALANDQRTDDGTPTCEIYDPATGQFHHATQMMSILAEPNMRQPCYRTAHVIMTGGILSVPNHADLYDRLTQTFTLEGSLLTQR